MKAIWTLPVAFMAVCGAAAETSVKEGLRLEFDAVRQPALRQTAGLPPLGNGAPMDRWLDDSAGAFIASQASPAARPSDSTRRDRKTTQPLSLVLAVGRRYFKN